MVPDVSGGRETAKEDPKDVHPSTAADVGILRESDTVSILDLKQSSSLICTSVRRC